MTRERRRLAGFVVFALLSAWTTVAIVVSLVRVAVGSAHPHARVYAVAVALLALFALWTGTRAVRLRRQIVADR